MRPATCLPSLPACLPTRPVPFSPTQDWEQEELQAYAMFEAVVAAEARKAGAGGAASASAKKLQRNKNTLSAAASAEQLRQGARSQYEKGVPMTASQRRLARNKQNAGGLGAGMRASLGGQG